jgi:hypothetical protein
MIIKMQVSQASSRPGRMVLVYNQDRSIFYEEPLTDEIAALMYGRPKAYFHADLDGTGLEIGDEVLAQPW